MCTKSAEKSAASCGLARVGTPIPAPLLEQTARHTIATSTQGEHANFHRGSVWAQRHARVGSKIFRRILHKISGKSALRTVGLHNWIFVLTIEVF